MSSVTEIMIAWTAAMRFPALVKGERGVSSLLFSFFISFFFLYFFSCVPFFFFSQASPKDEMKKNDDIMVG